jgi:hypothetical protein
MFTLRFISIERETVVSCQSYEIVNNGAEANTVIAHPRLGGIQIVGVEYHISDVTADCYSTCFVTNLEGKTIDKITPPCDAPPRSMHEEGIAGRAG